MEPIEWAIMLTISGLAVGFLVSVLIHMRMMRDKPRHKRDEV